MGCRILNNNTINIHGFAGVKGMYANLSGFNFKFWASFDNSYSSSIWLNLNECILEFKDESIIKECDEYLWFS